MQFRVGCELQYRAASDSTLLFAIHAAESASQTLLEEQLQVEPQLAAEVGMMPDAARRYLRIHSGPGPITVRYEACVERTWEWGTGAEAEETPPSRLPPEVFPYLLPSRYCPSERLVSFADKEFGGIAPGFTRVTAICNWIYDRLEYLPGSSDTGTTAIETLIQGAGVCRDYAHLGISFCRALNLPARYLSAYAWGLPQPDFHACFECYLGGRWVQFDATRLAPLTGFVRIGDGRDAADIAFSTVYGMAELVSMQTQVEVMPGPDGAVDAPPWTTEPLLWR